MGDHSRWAGAQSPLAGPKLVAPKAKYNFNPISNDDLVEEEDEQFNSNTNENHGNINSNRHFNSNSNHSPNPINRSPLTSSSPFSSPLFSIPQRHPSPSPSPSPSQITKPPSRASLRSPKPESTRTPTPNDELLFESHCKSFFGLISSINQQNGKEEINLLSDLTANLNDEERLQYQERINFSRIFIDRILSSCPPSHRATYNRIQSKVRQLYHSKVELSRQKSLNSFIESIEPNSKLSGFCRKHLDSIASKIERRNKLNEFIMKHCSKEKVGIHPFFASLKSLFNLQCKSSSSGGGGSRGLVWRMDDAVLMETGGEVFMKDAIELLKGVLGFSEESIESSTSNPILSEQDPFKDSETVNQNLQQNKRLSLINGLGTFVPGFSNSPPSYLRFWYLSNHLTNPELSFLARDIPKFVLSGRNPPKLKPISEKELNSSTSNSNSNSSSRLEEGHHHSSTTDFENENESDGIHLSRSNDQENFITSSQSNDSSLNQINSSKESQHLLKDFSNLPTGLVRRGNLLKSKRNKGWKGTLIQRFLNWLRSFFHS